MSELLPIAIGALVSSTLLVIEHLALWPYKKLPSFLARYILGTIALGLGLTAWAALTDRLIAAVAFWGVAGCGGFTVIVAYWIRWQYDRSLSETDRRAFWAGQVAGLPEEHDGPTSRSHTRSN